MRSLPNVPRGERTSARVSSTLKKQLTPNPRPKVPPPAMRARPPAPPPAVSAACGVLVSGGRGEAFFWLLVAGALPAGAQSSGCGGCGTQYAHWWPRALRQCQAGPRRNVCWRKGNTMRSFPTPFPHSLEPPSRPRGQRSGELRRGNTTRSLSRTYSCSRSVNSTSRSLAGG